MNSNFARESNFGLEELFFSRTNNNGVILSGNSVFQRVSAYNWEELLNKPHSLIRHSSMPKAVFHLLWETILSGQPIGAYVVNRAKNGDYYWVFALVSPIENGFLSIRLKPSSAYFPVVQEKYSELLELERRNKISPAESQKILLEEIQKLGFKDYQHFMSEALLAEMETRQESLGLPPIWALNDLRKIFEQGKMLQTKCEEIFSAYKKSSLVPINLEIQAGNIGKEGASIAIISSQYDELAKEIQKETHKFMEAGNLVNEKVKNCQFDICSSLLQEEMYSFFQKENKKTPIAKEEEMVLLQNLGHKGMEKACLRLQEIKTEFDRFQKIYEEIRKLSLALDIVSLTGKIEAAKIQQESGELKNLLDDLINFKIILKDSLNEINNIGKNLISSSDQMRMGLSTYQ